MRLKVLDKLVLKGSIGPYLLSFFIVEFVLLMQKLWQVIDDILGKGYGIWDYFELLYYLSIVLIPLSLPLTVLLSSVMVYGDMAEKYELTSIKSAGVSLFRALRPGLILALLTCIFSFYASNILKPKANERFIKKMKDMKTNELTFVFDEKIFNKEFDNYSIWIDKKDNDGRSINGIRIYDHTDADKSIVNMTYAKYGEMYTTADQKYLIMELSEGYSFKEIRSESADAKRKSFGSAGRPLSRIYFKHMQKVFKLSELLNLNMTNTSHKRHDMMTSRELFEYQDSLLIETKNLRLATTFDYGNLVKDYNLKNKTSRKQEVKEKNQSRDSELMQNRKKELKRSVNVKKIAQDIYLPDLLSDDMPDSSIIEQIVVKERRMIIDRALKNSMAARDRVFNKWNEIKIKNGRIAFAKLRLHQQFSWAVVCLIFLFIGGPAGAIVRKGGFGFPLLIAILFYMIFIMTSISGEKLLSSGAMGPLSSAWLPCLLLLPFATILSYMALNDKNINSIGVVDRLKKLFNQKDS